MYLKLTFVLFSASSAFYGSPSPATKTTTGPLESISSIASSRLEEGLSIASAQYASLKSSITSSSGLAQDPVLLDAERRYHEAVGLAHDHYTAFINSASQAVFGAPTPTPSSSHLQDFLEEAESQYSQASSLASASLAAVVASVTSAMGSTTEDPARSIVDDASSRYSAALSAASTSLSLASASASSALYGTPTGTLEAAASKASENWESLISRASEQVYATPAPSVQQQPVPYEALENLISELMAGKEPEFTESIMSKLRLAYETPYPAAALSSVSSYANDAYASASSQVSEAVYGTQPGYVEAARSQVDEAFSSAQSVLSTAVYGTSTGRAESAFSTASGTYASVTSAVADNVSAASSVINSAYSDLHSRASSVLSPEEKGALESAQARHSDLASEADDYASEVDSSAASVADNYQSGATSAASKIKDEL